MTNPELYRDDSRVRHMLDAMEHILAIAATLPPEPATPPPNMEEFL